MATEYFGYCDINGVATGSTTEYAASEEMNWREENSVGDACPGSGAMAVKTIGLMGRLATFDAIMAIYSEDGTLLCHSTSAKTAIADDWVSWSDTEITWDSGTTLTGGTRYHICFIITSAGGPFGVVGGVNGSVYCQRLDAGHSSFPASLPTGTQGQEYFNVRVGVDTAGGGAVSSITAQIVQQMNQLGGC